MNENYHVENCPQCGAPIDVTGLSPLADAVCPACRANIQLRTKFDQFTLLERIGSGGMGEVFRAHDEKLQREVALKVLRPELGDSEEEQQKLIEEARRTATINHPHVVKVFGFGVSQGQFYLAMELVSKGTLDDLMTLQGRVAEMQVLNVALEISSGLQAALQAGLIHRDIKPGNILFAGNGSSKLVDFGLAVIMDEAAAERGEIWGTPYYVAPEKLDGLPEDFRSDMYSLGGTLFHALSGRPPYEAETASMVALKQLKSQPVSLQSFAPDISDETNYVINRMMVKEPSGRYASYEELIEHLQFARDKLHQKITGSSPVGHQVPLLVESREQKKLIGLIMLIVVVGFLLLGVVGFFQREQVLAFMGIQTRPAATHLDIRQERQDARALLLQGEVAKALEAFQRLGETPGLPEVENRWITLELGLTQLAGGDARGARATFSRLSKNPLPRDNPAQTDLSNFLSEISYFMAEGRSLTPGTLTEYSRENYQAIAWLLFGLNNWIYSGATDAVPVLQQFVSSSPRGSDSWIEEYRSLARAWIAAAPEFGPLQSEIRRAPNQQARQTILQGIESKNNGAWRSAPGLPEQLQQLAN
jgi:hypothetical protein